MTTEKAENPITTELAKQNVTEQVIADLKKKYLPLKIDGIEDLTGYKTVHDARMVCRDTRVLAEKICKSGREDAIKTQKAWITKEKEVVAQISEIEQYLKKQEGAIDTEIENNKIRAERILKLPGRKEQVKGIESYLGELSDKTIMEHDDSQWREAILTAKGAKLDAEQKKIDEAKAISDQKLLVARINEMTKAGVTVYSDGLSKFYRKGSFYVSEDTIIEAEEQGWLVIMANFERETVSEKPKDVTLRPRTYSECYKPQEQTEISDEEKLFNYATALENVSCVKLSTKEGEATFAKAQDLLTQLLIILRS